MRRVTRSTSATRLASISAWEWGGRPEGALRSHGAAPAPRLDRPGVAVVGECVQLAAGRAAEHRHQQLRRLGCQLTDGADAVVVELLGGDPADAPHLLHGERVEKAQLAVGRHHQQAVGLGDTAGDLGQELGAGHADRDRQPDVGQDRATEPGGDLARGAGEVLEPAHVEERLVDRQPLDRGRELVEDAVGRLACLGVGGEPWGDHDGVGTQPAGGPAAHRRSHPERAGLVAGRQHHPAADDHRAPAKGRVVSLLDRRVERVEVGVQDAGRGSHRTYVRTPRPQSNCAAGGDAP